MAVVTATLLRIVRSRAFRQMRRRPTPPSGCRTAWVLALSLALLFSQFLGLAHGIAHAGWAGSIDRPGHAAFDAALFNYVDDADDDLDDVDGKQGAGHGKHHHSCVEYDAASGATGIHAGVFSPPLIPGVRVLALWQAFASWDAPAVCHFSSRAPPR
ncbi:hypothetical protein [Herbaspirillum sp. RV1423]|uniref:hypothetical protein n=1 Tax=Herbaspirillum sp. RV1423 TaxID=1443993 RepID=UPI0004BA3C49|nr:hypothetical protein [Herbaspirillum sp. RV1423]